MIWIKKIFKSGGSSHIVLPKAWMTTIMHKLGFMPKEVTITEVNDDLLVKAVKPPENKGVK